MRHREVFGGSCGKTARPSTVQGIATHPYRTTERFDSRTRHTGRIIQQVQPVDGAVPSGSTPGPGTAGPYNYTSASSLIALNNAWPSSTPTVDRKVKLHTRRRLPARSAMQASKPNPSYSGEGNRTYADAAVAGSGSQHESQ